jgi:uncharacterized DUF497 family protein
MVSRKAGMKFDWDPQKATINANKHNVTFQEEATVFGDPLALTFEDPELKLEYVVATINVKEQKLKLFLDKKQKEKG